MRTAVTCVVGSALCVAALASCSERSSSVDPLSGNGPANDLAGNATVVTIDGTVTKYGPADRCETSQGTYNVVGAANDKLNITVNFDAEDHSKLVGVGLINVGDNGLSLAYDRDHPLPGTTATYTLDGKTYHLRGVLFGYNRNGPAGEHVTRNFTLDVTCP